MIDQVRQLLHSNRVSISEFDATPSRALQRTYPWVVIPYERTRKVGVLTPLSEAEIQALKNQVGR